MRLNKIPYRRTTNGFKFQIIHRTLEYIIRRLLLLEYIYRMVDIHYLILVLTLFTVFTCSSAALAAPPEAQGNWFTPRQNGSQLKIPKLSDDEQSAHHFIPRPALRAAFNLMTIADYERFREMMHRFTGCCSYSVPNKEEFIYLNVNLFFGPLSNVRLNDPGDDNDRHRSLFEVDQWPLSIAQKYPSAIEKMNKLWLAVKSALVIHLSCSVGKGNALWTSPYKENLRDFPQMKILFSSLEDALDEWQKVGVTIQFNRETAFEYNSDDWVCSESKDKSILWTLFELEAQSSSTSRKHSCGVLAKITEAPAHELKAAHNEKSVAGDREGSGNVFVTRKQYKGESNGAYIWRNESPHKFHYPAGYYLQESSITNGIAIRAKEETLMEAFETWHTLFRYKKKKSSLAAKFLRQKLSSIGEDFSDSALLRATQELHVVIQKLIGSPIDQCNGSKISDVLLMPQRFTDEHITQIASDRREEDDTLPAGDDTPGDDTPLDDIHAEPAVPALPASAVMVDSGYQIGEENTTWDLHIMEKMKERVYEYYNDYSKNLQDFFVLSAVTFDSRVIKRKESPIHGAILKWGEEHYLVWEETMINIFFAVEMMNYTLTKQREILNSFQSNPIDAGVNIEYKERYANAWKNDMMNLHDFEALFELTKAGTDMEINNMFQILITDDVELKEFQDSIQKVLRSVHNCMQIMRDFIAFTRQMEYKWVTGSLEHQHIPNRIARNILAARHINTLISENEVEVLHSEKKTRQFRSIPPLDERKYLIKSEGFHVTSVFHYHLRENSDYDLKVQFNVDDDPYMAAAFSAIQSVKDAGYKETDPVYENTVLTLMAQILPLIINYMSELPRDIQPNLKFADKWVVDGEDHPCDRYFGIQLVFGKSEKPTLPTNKELRDPVYICYNKRIDETGDVLSLYKDFLKGYMSEHDRLIFLTGFGRHVTPSIARGQKVTLGVSDRDAFTFDTKDKLKQVTTQANTFLSKIMTEAGESLSKQHQKDLLDKIINNYKLRVALERVRCGKFHGEIGSLVQIFQFLSSVPEENLMKYKQDVEQARTDEQRLEYLLSNLEKASQFHKELESLLRRNPLAQLPRSARVNPRARGQQSAEVGPGKLGKLGKPKTNKEKRALKRGEELASLQGKPKDEAKVPQKGKKGKKRGKKKKK